MVFDGYEMGGLGHPRRQAPPWSVLAPDPPDSVRSFRLRAAGSHPRSYPQRPPTKT